MLEECNKVQMLEHYKEAGGKTLGEEKPHCAHCNKLGHEEKDCYQKYGEDNAGRVANATGSGAKEPSKCPICEIGHVHTEPKGWTCNVDRCKYCPKFIDMSTMEKACQVENVKGCIMCLDCSGSHKGKDCTWFKNLCGEGRCVKTHN